jgi:hypothetical protein
VIHVPQINETLVAEGLRFPSWWKLYCGSILPIGHFASERFQIFGPLFAPLVEQFPGVIFRAIFGERAVSGIGSQHDDVDLSRFG